MITIKNIRGCTFSMRQSGEDRSAVFDIRCEVDTNTNNVAGKACLDFNERQAEYSKLFNNL